MKNKPEKSEIVELKGPNGETYEVWWETVNPKRASQLLEHLPKQRCISAPHITKLCSVIANGGWDDLNGAFIVLTPDGKVLNGRHRLQSVVETGVSITTFFIKGITETIAEYSMDQYAKNRNLADFLDMYEEKNSKILAQGICLLSAYKEINLGKTIRKQGTRTDDLKYAILDNRQAHNLLKKHPTLRASTNYAKDGLMQATPRILPASMLTFFHYVFTRIDLDKGNKFCETLIFRYSSNEEDDPALRVRDCLTTAKLTTKKAQRLQKLEVMALIINGWNASVQDKHISNVRKLLWKIGEPFPVIADADGNEYNYEQLCKGKNQKQ